MRKIDLQRLTLSCAGTWCALDPALRDGGVPDPLRESLHLARAALDTAGAQLVALVRRDDTTTEGRRMTYEQLPCAWCGRILTPAGWCRRCDGPLDDDMDDDAIDGIMHAMGKDD